MTPRSHGRADRRSCPRRSGLLSPGPGVRDGALHPGAPLGIAALFFALGLASQCGEPPRAAASPATAALAEAVAALTVNEAGVDAEADARLILQCAETRAETTWGRVRWLHAHSRRVLGSMCDGVGQCEWTRHLRAGITRPPPDFPAGMSWLRFLPQWRELLASVEAMIATGDWERPCPEPPWTWGAEDLDGDIARARGLRPLGCVGTRNEGWAPARSIPEASP